MDTDTVALANRGHASTIGPDGEQLMFVPDQAVELPSEFAHSLLQHRAAGFYIPGEKQAEFDPNPGRSLVDEERRGMTKPSPFPSTEEGEKEQAALDAAEADRLIAEGPAIPPKYGRGSSAAAWLEYAEILGHTPPDGASRDDIVAFLEARGLPTEQSGSTASILGAVPDDEDEEATPQPPTVQSETDPAVAEAEVAPAGESAG